MTLLVFCDSVRRCWKSRRTSITYAVDRLVDHMVNWDDLAGNTCCHHFVGTPYHPVDRIDLDLDLRLFGIR